MVKAHLKTGSLLEKPKSINVFRDGAWLEQQMGYVYFQGKWVPFIEYLFYVYKEGIENVKMVEGHDFNSRFRLIRNAEYLEFRQVATSSNFSKIETEHPVNVTNFSTLNVDWEVNQTGRLIGLAQAQKVAKFDLEKHEDGVIKSRHITTVDISDVMGDYYVKIGLHATSSHFSSKIYNIWLE